MLQVKGVFRGLALVYPPRVAVGVLQEFMGLDRTEDLYIFRLATHQHQEMAPPRGPLATKMSHLVAESTVTLKIQRSIPCKGTRSLVPVIL